MDDTFTIELQVRDLGNKVAAHLMARHETILPLVEQAVDDFINSGGLNKAVQQAVEKAAREVLDRAARQMSWNEPAAQAIGEAMANALARPRDV